MHNTMVRNSHERQRHALDTLLILDFNLKKYKKRYITFGFVSDFINKPNLCKNNFETAKTISLIGGSFT